MAIINLHDYLHFQATQMLDFERNIERLNSDMIKHSHDERLGKIFRWHAKHLSEQISNLEEIIKLLGGPSEQHESSIAKGIVSSQQTLYGNAPPEQLLDISNIQSAHTISQAKIAMYQGLIEIAHLLGNRSIIEKLERNQADEERMRSRILYTQRSIVTTLGLSLPKAA